MLTASIVQERSRGFGNNSGQVVHNSTHLSLTDNLVLIVIDGRERQFMESNYEPGGKQRTGAAG